MQFIELLNLILAIITVLNVVTNFPHSNEEEKHIEIYKNRTWRDRVWTAILILACILYVGIVLFVSFRLKFEQALYVFLVFSYLEQIARSISSAGTVINIVTKKGRENLDSNDYLAISTLAILVGWFYASGAFDKIVEIAKSQPNSIFTDWILLACYVFSIAIISFFICSLALKPLKLVVKFLNKILSKIKTKKINQLSTVLRKWGIEISSTKCMTVRLIDYILSRRKTIYCILWILVPAALLIDVIFIVILVAWLIIVSIVWYLIFIISSVSEKISDFMGWILSVSERNVVAFSFRISTILGFGSTVIINQYDPFLLNQETVEIFEFLTSTILIPIILEWIISYKNN